MRLPKRGEKGFTLIELLIVVAILGVLAAVVIPNVTRFFGKGEEEARRTERHNVTLAVASMMVDNKLPGIPTPINYAGNTATRAMTAFPDSMTAGASAGKLTDPEGYLYDVADGPGYLLYGHDIYGGTVADPNPKNGDPDVNYLMTTTTTYYYTCEADGTVRQFDRADLTDPGLFEYTD